MIVKSMGDPLCAKPFPSHRRTSLRQSASYIVMEAGAHCGQSAVTFQYISQSGRERYLGILQLPLALLLNSWNNIEIQGAELGLQMYRQQRGRGRHCVLLRLQAVIRLNSKIQKF